MNWCGNCGNLTCPGGGVVLDGQGTTGGDAPPTGRDEYDPSSTDGSIIDHPRGFDVKGTCDGGEEVESRQHGELHNWGVRGGIRWERAVGGKWGRRGCLYMSRSEGSNSLPSDNAWNDVSGPRINCNLDTATWIRAHLHELQSSCAEPVVTGHWWRRCR